MKIKTHIEKKKLPSKKVKCEEEEKYLFFKKKITNKPHPYGNINSNSLETILPLFRHTKKLVKWADG